MSHPLHQLDYFHCQKENLHQNENLSIICLDKQCIENPLICPICQDESHQNHLTLPLKIFLDQIKNSFFLRDQNKLSQGFSQEYTIEKLQYIIEKQNNSYQQIASKMKELIVEIASQIQKLEINIISSKKILQQNKQFDKFNKILPRQTETALKQINSLFNPLNQELEFLKSVDKQFTELNQIILPLQENIFLDFQLKEIKKLKTNFMQKFSSERQIPDFLNLAHIPLKLGESIHSPEFQLKFDSNSVLKKTDHVNSELINNSLIYLQPKFDILQPIFQFFKIEKLTGKCTIGISKFTSLKNQIGLNSQFFGVSNSGILQKEKQFCQTNFEFGENDTLAILTNPKQKQVHYYVFDSYLLSQKLKNNQYEFPEFKQDNIQNQTTQNQQSQQNGKTAENQQINQNQDKKSENNNDFNTKNNINNEKLLKNRITQDKIDLMWPKSADFYNFFINLEKKDSEIKIIEMKPLSSQFAQLIVLDEILNSLYTDYLKGNLYLDLNYNNKKEEEENEEEEMGFCGGLFGDQEEDDYYNKNQVCHKYQPVYTNQVIKNIQNKENNQKPADSVSESDDYMDFGLFD
ncbi:hypothetical protein PPERSA_12647 [Pseudocohnilembus persalinus]|uniref:Uncharacterized protein n=1 Tax=Pseudocohnilembus persalinus TaxID=266149 RepID=A0A0V0QMT2_PSEPJ|nr:hypothetical protein PPERSA_12647 [Pseudocohnilembus persalinus]|eukprot:KRX03368.1 hypothetical protein PPERSA_12647 [Pseudocohnilembus persalinus]